MSMTQVVFLKESKMPTIKQIEEVVQGLGYDLRIGGDPDNKISNEGLECSINGHETYFETEVAGKENAIASLGADWIKPDLTDQDTAISFYWGADFAAGACIGLISVALIEHADALVYYMDDEMKYSKEALLEEMPLYLGELDKKPKNVEPQQVITPEEIEAPIENTGKSLWSKIKDIFG